jgi:hypothetical protein
VLIVFSHLASNNTYDLREDIFLSSKRRMRNLFYALAMENA